MNTLWTIKSEPRWKPNGSLSCKELIQFIELTLKDSALHSYFTKRLKMDVLPWSQVLVSTIIYNFKI